jgi:putative nucleotidyltransferase with HDIG domain
MNVAGWAEDTARTLLESALPRRWAHSQGVAAQARRLAPILGADTDLLTAAAWLHDIGYAPVVHDTGFHPLDGARYLRDVERTDNQLCRLVANHSGAMVEATEHGLADELAREFEPVRRDLADALSYCDMTTGPDGQHMSIEQRLAEIHARYGPGHYVSRAITRSTPHLTRAVVCVSRRLTDAAPTLRPEAPCRRRVLAGTT